jgi:phosphatidylglycerol:prolipoprotein diacylglycerol transferase
MYPIIQLSDSLYIPTYFLVIAIGYVLGMLWLVPRSRKFEMNPVIGLDVTMLIMTSGFIGSRLLHVILEQPERYINNPIEILKFWQGGFVFYGGAIAALITSLVYLRIKNESIAQWSFVFAPIIPFVYGIGRIATLLSGSGYGKPTTLPWGIMYPPGTEAPSGISLHPTPIYAALWAFSSMALLLLLQNKKFARGSILFLIMVILHGLGRLLMEQLRDDYRGPLFFGFTVSTWLSCLIIIACLGLVKKLHKP